MYKFHLLALFRLTVLIFFLFGILTLDAQQGRIDSLHHLISTTKRDTAKIDLYEKLGLEYRNEKKMDSSIMSYKTALEINEKTNYSLQKQCWDIATIDFVLYEMGNYAESLKYASRNLILSEQLKDTFQMGFSHAAFGHDYKSLGEYRQALKHYFKARQVFMSYFKTRNETEKDPYIIQCIGEVYLKLNQLDSALIFTQQSLLQTGTDPGNKLYSTRILGDIYFARGDNQRTLNYYREYIPGFIKYNGPDYTRYKHNNRSLGFVFNNMANIFQKINQKDSAVFYARKALSNAQEYHDQENIYVAATSLYNLYKVKEDNKTSPEPIMGHNSIDQFPGGRVNLYNYSERRKIDSLQNLISNTKKDTAKIDLYENLGQAYREDTKMDSSVLCYKKALEINEKTNYSLQKQCWDIGTIDYLLYEMGDYTESLKCATFHLLLSEKLNDTFQKGFSHLVFGHDYRELGEFSLSLDHYFKAYQFFKIYHHNRNEYEDNTFTILCISQVYLKLKQFDSALLFAREAYTIGITRSERSYMLLATRISGDIYFAQGEYNAALQFYRQYIPDFVRYKEKNRDMGFVLNGLANIYQKINQKDSAIFYAKKAFINATVYGDQENRYDAASSLYNLYKDSSEHDAFKYFKIATAAKDSMASIEKIRQIQMLTFNEQTREKQAAEADAREAARTKRIFTVAAILVLIASFLAWNRIRQLRMKHKMVLEQREVERLRAKYEKDLMELEAKALRSQMNPHFIYNCMNSIKSLMQLKEEEKAINYLTTFSKLMRTLFQNSDKRQISLYDEIETCRLYVQLEAMRLNYLLQYQFDIDPNLDLKSVMVPALIIQPFIENAIWHGIVPKGEGNICITVKGNNESVICEVNDDGIGREMSKLNKPITPLMHESKGVHLSQARLNLENLLNEMNATVETFDKNEAGIATGTRVIFTFKLN